MHKTWLSANPSTKNKHVIQTDLCANVIKAVISEAGDELICPTAPTNSSSLIEYEVQQCSGQHFPTKIEMVLKKCVVLKESVSTSCKVFVPDRCSMDIQAGKKCKDAG